LLCKIVYVFHAYFQIIKKSVIVQRDTL